MGKQDMQRALEATLLFWSGEIWDDKHADKWKDLTGTDECTSANLCDFIRSVLKGEHDSELEGVFDGPVIGGAESAERRVEAGD